MVKDTFVVQEIYHTNVQGKENRTKLGGLKIA
jgi:hypothetical protein